jgi:Domain of unknown function (DUF4386)
MCKARSVLRVLVTTRTAAEAAGRGAAQPDMASASAGRGLRRTTGGLFVAGAVAFAAATMVLSATFNWPDILREPASVVLPAFAGGGSSLVWTWFATGWTYAILAVTILLLPAVLGRRDDPALRVATYAGASSVVLSLTGFLRWVFVVPPLARSLSPAMPPPGQRRTPRGPPSISTAARCSVSTWGSCSSRPVGHPVRDHRAHSGPAPLARRHWARRQRAVPTQPGRHPGHRGPRVPGLGPGRPDRQNPAGESGWPPSGVTILLRPAPATLRGPAPATRPATAGAPGAEHRISTRPPPGPHAAHTGPPLTDSRERPTDRSTS